MKQHAASGELHLSGVGKAERGEVLRVLRNEEERAREKNPLGRIMRMEADGALESRDHYGKAGAAVRTVAAQGARRESLLQVVSQQ
jgi:hypothetical protein